MYSTKEKLYHFRQLANPLAAEADLALLHEKNPQSTDFTRFDLAPQKNAEDILFALLDIADHDEIVRNRREFVADAAGEDNDNNTANNSSGEGDENPETLNSNGDETPDANSGEGDENPETLNSNGDETPDANSGEGDENPSAGEGDDDSSKKEKAKAPSKKKKKNIPK